MMLFSSPFPSSILVRHIWQGKALHWAALSLTAQTKTLLPSPPISLGFHTYSGYFWCYILRRFLLIPALHLFPAFLEKINTRFLAAFTVFSANFPFYKKWYPIFRRFRFLMPFPSPFQTISINDRFYFPARLSCLSWMPGFTFPCLSEAYRSRVFPETTASSAPLLEPSCLQKMMLYFSPISVILDSIENDTFFFA